MYPLVSEFNAQGLEILNKIIQAVGWRGNRAVTVTTQVVTDAGEIRCDVWHQPVPGDLA